MTPTDFQIALASMGLSPGPADGLWGPKTEAAAKQWFKMGRSLGAPPVPVPRPTPGGLIPSSWLTPAKMSRVITHWTAGAYAVSNLDKDHYHIIIDGNGVLVRGDHSISDNVNTSDGDYAAHTRGLNTGSIGVSVAAMAGARERPFDPGRFPMNEVQWETMARVVAELCSFYKIPVTPQTVLGHGEVEDILGVTQSGKWDPMVLPWKLGLTFRQVGDLFRERVAHYLNTAKGV